MTERPVPSSTGNVGMHNVDPESVTYRAARDDTDEQSYAWVQIGGAAQGVGVTVFMPDDPQHAIELCEAIITSFDLARSVALERIP